MGNAHRFWDRMANRYAKSPVSDEVAYKAKLNKTLEFLTLDSSVLEFGCGTGSTAIFLAPQVKTYLATDISGKMLEIARGRMLDTENLTFEQGSLEDVTPPKAGFDAVLGHSILHLIPDKERAIARVFTLLKPGGVFISSTVCLNRGGLLNGALWAGNKVGLLPEIAFFSQKSLEIAMVTAGFELEHSWQPKPKAALFLVARKPR